MVKITCISKVRNEKGDIITYNLREDTGREFTATASEIKAEIRAGCYDFTNLQINKLGRLVDKAAHKEHVKKSVVQSKSKSKDVYQNIVKQWLKEEAPKYKKEFSSESFKADFKGQGLRWDEENDKGNYAYSLPKEVITFFKKYIDDIRNMAREDSVKLYLGNDWDEKKPDEEMIQYSKLPVSVTSMFGKTGISYEIIKALYDLAAEDYGLASIRIKDWYDYDGWYADTIILTSNYEKALCYMASYADVIKDFTEEYDFEANVQADANMLGMAFFTKFKFDKLFSGKNAYKNWIMTESEKLYSEDDEYRYDLYKLLDTAYFGLYFFGQYEKNDYNENNNNDVYMVYDFNEMKVYYAVNPDYNHGVRQKFINYNHAKRDKMETMIESIMEYFRAKKKLNTF